MSIVKDIFTTNKLFISWEEVWKKYVEKRSKYYKIYKNFENLKSFSNLYIFKKLPASS